MSQPPPSKPHLLNARTNIKFVFDAIQPLQLTVTPCLLQTIRPELLLTITAYLLVMIRQYLLLLHHIHCLQTASTAIRPYLRY